MYLPVVNSSSSSIRFYRLYQYISVVNSSSSATRCMQTVSVSICRQQLQLWYTLCVDCINIVNSSSSAIRCMQTVSISICRQQLQLIYTLFIDCISIYLSSTAPPPVYAVCRLYQNLSVANSFSSSTRCLQIISVSICRQQLQLRYTLNVDCIGIVNSSSSAIRCMQTVSGSICRQQLQLLYTLFIDCISIYLSSTAPAKLYAVCRLYQYLSVANSSSSAIRCLQTLSVSISRQHLQLLYTLFIDCISIYLSSTAPASLLAVYRRYQYLFVVNNSSSAIRCLQTVSVSIYRQQLQLLYTLFIDCISIYLSSTAPPQLPVFYRLYRYLFVVNSSSSSIRCLQIVLVPICRQQLQLLYTLYVDCISIFLSLRAPAPLYAGCRLYQYRQQLLLGYTLYVDCIRIYLSSTAPASLYAVCRLYQYLSVVNSCSSAIRCLQTVSVSICRQQLQLHYTLFIDCISIYLSSTAPAHLYPVYRLYQYVSVVNSSSSSIRCLQTISVPICRQQLQLLYTLFIDCISIYLSSTAPAPLYDVCRLYVSTCRQQLQLLYTLLQTVSVHICRQQLQLRYTLYVDCISIYLS